MPITGQEGREDPLNQSQLPMLTLRLTLTTTIEDIFGEGRGDQQSLTPSLQLMPRLTHGIFMEDTMDMDMDWIRSLRIPLWILFGIRTIKKTSMKCQKLL